MSAGSRKAVVTAIAGNASLTVLKFAAAFATHSASMMNEAVHSLMDTLNQVFLYFGLVQGARPADRRYAFGHGQKKYLWNLWSAIGLFSIGSGLGLAHAWHAYHALDVQTVPGVVPLLGYAVPSLAVSALVLLIALVVEGYVLIVALRELLRRMRAEGERRPLAYLARAQDPTLIAVVLEDTVAVLGVLCAALGIGLSAWTGSRLWDIGFSVVIAVMLGLVAFFLGAVNMRYLSDIRDRDAERAFREVAKGLREVERFHDLRSVVVDESNTVVVAEVELREEVMMAGLRDRIAEIERELHARVPDRRRHDADLRHYVNARAVVTATLERAEEVIDEIEARVRQRCPRVTHITIEVEGIAKPRTDLLTAARDAALPA